MVKLSLRVRSSNYLDHIEDNLRESLKLFHIILNYNLTIGVN